MVKRRGRGYEGTLHNLASFRERPGKPVRTSRQRMSKMQTSASIAVDVDVVNH